MQSEQTDRQMQWQTETETALASADALLRRLRRQIIGHQNCSLIPSPFPIAPIDAATSPLPPPAASNSRLSHSRALFYADWTATSRSLASIERYLGHRVLPYAANTHTESSYTGTHTQWLREEARAIILRACGGGNDDVCLFAGNGTTAAFGKLLELLLRPLTSSTASLPAGIDATPWTSVTQRAAFVIGPYAHHSILLPLRESGHAVFEIAEDPIRGGPDLDMLRCTLQSLSSPSSAFALRVGVFTAASNLTGIVCDQRAVTALLHQHSFLACWDYATAASFLPVEMSSPSEPLLSKDAVFFSGHKLMGALSSPGVLLIKKKLLCPPSSSSAFSSNSSSTFNAPSSPAGGTVLFVWPTHHAYLQDFVLREEGGSPDAVGAIRLGLAFTVMAPAKAALLVVHESHSSSIHASSLSPSSSSASISLTLSAVFFNWAEAFLARLSACPQLVFAGNSRAARLPIFSFLIRPLFTASSRFLHPNFVSALLNDLFGIQSRSGCQCAGPYASHCLGLSVESTLRLTDAFTARQQILRPGFTRVSLHTLSSRDEMEFLLRAIEFVAREGHRFLPVYTFDIESARFQHRTHAHREMGRTWLAAGPATDGELEANQGWAANELAQLEHESSLLPSSIAAEDVEDPWSLRRTKLLFDAALAAAAEIELSLLQPTAAHALSDSPLSAEFEALRWYLLPSEVLPARLREEQSKRQLRQQIDSQGAPNGSAFRAEEVEQAAENNVHKIVDDADEENERRSRLILQPPATVTSNCKEASQIISCASCPSAPLSTTPFVIRSWQATRITPESQSQLSRCRSCYHFHLTASIRGQCTACNCVHFAPMHDAVAALSSFSSASPSSSILSSPLPMVSSSAVVNLPTPPLSSDHFPPRVSVASFLKQPICAVLPSSSSSLSSSIPASSASLSSQLVPSALGSHQEFNKLSKKLAKLTLTALLEHEMIRDGDRVLVGVSGGKDSLTLLHLLLDFKRRSRIKFEIGAVTVDPNESGYDPSPLIGYFAQLQVPYFYEKQSIIEQAKTCMTGRASICAYCARMKRGILYSTCRQHKYNVLALGQHADDLAESCIMSLFFNGRLRTMKANYTIASGDLRVIRPLIRVREYLTRAYAGLAMLPVISENCPACFQAPKERQRVKLMLAQQESIHPHLVLSICQALQPLISIKRTGQEGSGQGLSVPHPVKEVRHNNKVPMHKLFEQQQIVAARSITTAAIMDDDDEC